MAHFIRNGIYMIGDMIYGDIAVPERPSLNHIWKNGEWVVDVKKKLKDAANSFKEDIGALQEQYLSALFTGDTDNAANLQAEAATRKADYAAEITQIRGAS